LGKSTQTERSRVMPEFYLTTTSGHSVSYQFIRSKVQKAETVVILSGLADDATVWKPLLKYLHSEPIQVLLVNLIGQGSALKKDLNRGISSFCVSITDQANALKLIFDQVGVNYPIHLVGFSYGGAVALQFQKQNPCLIKELHLWLPFVMRLDLASPFLQMWKQNVEVILSLNPISEFWLKKWSNFYNEWIFHYMHFRFSKRIPEKTLRQVAVEMSQGALDFEGISIIRNLKNCRTHLVMSHMDTLVPLTLYNEIWARIPRSEKGYCLRVRDGEHLLHEQSPLLLAKWLKFCLNHRESSGREFDGYAASGEIRTKESSRAHLKWA